MFVVALFLILLVLVQRGRGGGLTGALGGMGGQSAFGTKAGDMFTRVTMVTAGVWILLCMFSIWMLGSQDEWAASGKKGPGSGSPGAVTFPGSDSPAAPSVPAPGTSGAGEADTGAGAASPGPAEAPSGGSATTLPEASQEQDAAKAKE
jgi:preprotein translocase subunit SecG